MILASNSIHEAINVHSAALSSSSFSIVAAAPSIISDTKSQWQPASTSSLSSARQQQAWLLHTPATINEDVVTTTIQQQQQVSPSSSIYISSTTTTSTTADWTQQLLQLKQSQSPITKDKVKRVIDSSTILLEKSGTVSLDIVRGAGSTYVLPECCTYAPSYKLRQLLKKGMNVKIVNLSSSSSGSGASSSSSAARPKVWIIRSQDELIVNREIVKSGFGFVRKGTSTSSSSGGAGAASKMMMLDSSVVANFDYEGMMNDLTTLEETARSKGLGIFKTCNNDDTNGNKNSGDENAISTTSNFVAEFEPMEYTTEIQYGDDGGKSVLVSNSDKQQSSSSSLSGVIPPSNPGDVKGCSDFTYYEDALGYYERYYPYYGDVAKLDRDGDGVPCPGLPHTGNQDRYRMKLPKAM